jgi:hypothetical protein
MAVAGVIGAQKLPERQFLEIHKHKQQGHPQVALSWVNR